MAAKYKSPQRIHRKRTKGWRIPPNTVCVTRPGRWSNPFRVGGWFKWERRGAIRPLREAGRPGQRGFTLITDKAMAVAWFARLMKIDDRDLSELRGKNLACWCRPGETCHADLLLRLANQRLPTPPTNTSKP
jgi:hypothetical protein